MSNEVDVKDLFKLHEKLSLLTPAEISVILNKSLMAGARKLKTATTQSLIAKMGATATRPIYSTTTKKTYQPLTSGIRISNDPYENTVKVHIMGHGYLKWFESGTAIRQTRSGANRGSIKAINFFFAARQTTMSSLDSIIETSITKQIDSILQ